eukprot:1784287-Pleurochrysis_carterae.AAC.1
MLFSVTQQARAAVHKSRCRTIEDRGTKCLGRVVHLCHGIRAQVARVHRADRAEGDNGLAATLHTAPSDEHVGKIISNRNIRITSINKYA